MLFTRTNVIARPGAPGVPTRPARVARRRTARRVALNFEVMEGRALLSTLTVVNGADSGAGSLRQAVLDARDGDTIEFDESLRNRSIALTSGELVLDADVTIVGLGGDALAIDARGDSRVFRVTADADVRIEDLAVINGAATAGGGLLNEGGGVTLVGTYFFNNQALGVDPGQYGLGGAVASQGEGASLVVESSTFVSNRAAGARGADGGDGLINGTGGAGLGGAIYADAGTTTCISGSVFDGNRAVGGRGGDGGTGGSTGSAARAGEATWPSRAPTRRSRSRGASSSTRRPRGETAATVRATGTVSAGRVPGARSTPSGTKAG